MILNYGLARLYENLCLLDCANALKVSSFVQAYIRASKQIVCELHECEVKQINWRDYCKARAFTSEVNMNPANLEGLSKWK